MASDFVSYEDAVESLAKIFNSTTDRRKDDEVKIIFEKTGQNLSINQLLKKNLITLRFLLKETFENINNQLIIILQ